MYIDVNTHIINLGFVDFLNKREENKLLENCT